VLALAAGVMGVFALLPGRRPLRLTFAAGAALVVILALALFLGRERTIARFAPSTVGQQSVSRREAMRTSARLWQRFPLFGSGHGTFARVVSLEQDRDLGHLYHHAHNDYLEIAVTAGTLGLTIAVATLFGGFVALVRTTFGAAARELTWSRRAFQAAALASLAIAIVHALFDFNFFIPANPATLAAIAGAAVSSIDHDRRTRR
jgi:O-antigen ligase